MNLWWFKVNTASMFLFWFWIAVTAAAQQVASSTTVNWHAKFTPNTTLVHMNTQVKVLLELTGIDITQPANTYHVRSKDPHLANVDQIITASEINPATASWEGNITIDALFLGSTYIFVELNNNLTNTTEQIPENEQLLVSIMRQMRVIDHVFTGSVALLVTVLFINFGAVLDLTVLHGLIRRPIGPSIGFVLQFFGMPLLSFLLGYWIFPNNVEMQLGLFFTGISPAGGASNTWTVFLNGNINLSILMTTIGNFAAFFMMPFWIFTLGHIIFERGNMKVPYVEVARLVMPLLVALIIGLCIQKWAPRLTRLLIRLLKPMATFLILFIVIFAIITNLYLFELFSWQITLAGLALPWIGYIAAWFVAKLLSQNDEDALTIAIETGIQNTGIAIFLLKLGLPQPQADLTTVIPVACAIMTPLPLLGLYIYKRCTKNSVKDGIQEQQRIVGSVGSNDEQHHNPRYSGTE